MSRDRKPSLPLVIVILVAGLLAAGEAYAQFAAEAGARRRPAKVTGFSDSSYESQELRERVHQQ
jgi:hypothetical protein